MSDKKPIAEYDRDKHGRKVQALTENNDWISVTADEAEACWAFVDDRACVLTHFLPNLPE